MEPVDPRVDMVPQGESVPFEGPGYEATDISFRGVLVSGLVLALVIVVVMTILGGWYAIMARSERRQLDERSPRFADDTEQFPAPILQGSPASDMAVLRAQETEQLTSYGWVNEEQSVAHIPIGRAIELTLSRLQSSSADSPRSASPSEGKTGVTPSPAGETSISTREGHEPSAPVARDADGELPADPFKNSSADPSPN